MNKYTAHAFLICLIGRLFSAENALIERRPTCYQTVYNGLALSIGPVDSKEEGVSYAIRAAGCLLTRTSISHIVRDARNTSVFTEGAVLRNLKLGKFIGRGLPFDPRRSDFVEKWSKVGVNWEPVPDGALEPLKVTTFFNQNTIFWDLADEVTVVDLKPVKDALGIKDTK